MTKESSVNASDGPKPSVVRTVADALTAARLGHPAPTSQSEKKNFAERLSRHLATCFANALRPEFPGISPDENGKRQERRARTGKGFKRLDVNYSTVDLGLALGVSIKTINARDEKTKKYAKNFTRVDSELRAEAADYHKRQPYSVLVAIIFLPEDACDDATESTGASSFGSAVRHFRHRTGRERPTDDVELFELVFVGLYSERGAVRFFDAKSSPPRWRRPRADETLSFDEMNGAIHRTYAARNDPPFRWADDP